MINIDKDSKLIDFIKIYRQSIPADDCDLMLEELESYNIINYNWYDFEHFDCNYDRTRLPIKTRFILYNRTTQNLDHYTRTISKNKYSNLSPIYINKHINGSFVPTHIDNNNFLFKDIFSGVPLYSLIGVLNDGFDGGEIFFWDSYSINLKKGDIMIFPSNFLYPHNRKIIEKGSIYSFVRWAY